MAYSLRFGQIILTDGDISHFMHILCLHNVIAEEPDGFDQKNGRMSLTEFQQLLDQIQNRWPILTAQQTMQKLRNGQQNATFVALSFDDGYLGVYENVRGELKRRGLSAFLFINPGVSLPLSPFHFLELEVAFRLTTQTQLQTVLAGGPLGLQDEKKKIKALREVKKILRLLPEAERQENHQKILAQLQVKREQILSELKNHKKYQVMTLPQCKTLMEEGWVIGGHSMTHRTLSRLSNVELGCEINDCFSYLATHGLLNEKCFAYPYGEEEFVGQRAMQVCSEVGFEWAFSVEPQGQCQWMSPMRVPRWSYKNFLEFLKT